MLWKTKWVQFSRNKCTKHIWNNFLASPKKKGEPSIWCGENIWWQKSWYVLYATFFDPYWSKRCWFVRRFPDTFAFNHHPVFWIFKLVPTLEKMSKVLSSNGFICIQENHGPKYPFHFHPTTPAILEYNKRFAKAVCPR